MVLSAPTACLRCSFAALFQRTRSPHRRSTSTVAPARNIRTTAVQQYHRSHTIQQYSLSYRRCRPRCPLIIHHQYSHSKKRQFGVEALSRLTVSYFVTNIEQNSYFMALSMTPNNAEPCFFDQVSISCVLYRENNEPHSDVCDSPLRVYHNDLCACMNGVLLLLQGSCCRTMKGVGLHPPLNSYAGFPFT